MVKKSWINIGFIFLLPYLLLGQQGFVSLQIEPKTVEVGQEVVLTIKTNLEGKIDVALPDNFIRTSGTQSGMSSSVSIINGKREVSRTSFQSFSGYFSKKGSYLVGPAKVLFRQDEISSDSYTIQVNEPQNMMGQNPGINLNQMIFGIIEQSKKEIYEGESFVLEGKVYSQVNLLRVDDYTPFSFNGPCDSRTLDKAGQISIDYETVSGRSMQTFRIGKQVVFPTKVGEYEIKPFELTILHEGVRSIFPKSSKMISNGTTLKVKPLPGGTPSEFIDAVGQFKITAELNRTELKQGEVVELKVNIKGKGNLQSLKHPVFDLPKGIALYGDPEVTDRFSFSLAGAEGEKSFIYFLQMNNPGIVQLDPIKIAYFNPKTEKYEFSEYPIEPINVEKSDVKISMDLAQTTNQESPSGVQPYFTENKLPNNSFVDLFSGIGGTIALLSPVFLGAFLGVFVRVKRKREDESRESKNFILEKNKTLSQLDILKNQTPSEEMFVELSNLLIGHLASYFKVNKSNITREFLAAQKSDSFSPEIHQEITAVFSKLDAVKYGQSTGGGEHINWIDKVKNIVNAL